VALRIVGGRVGGVGVGRGRGVAWGHSPLSIIAHFMQPPTFLFLVVFSFLNNPVSALSLHVTLKDWPGRGGMGNQRDGLRESISRKFTMSRKFSKHPSISLFFRYFVQKHKTNYLKTSLIQIPGVDTGVAKIFCFFRTSNTRRPRRTTSPP